MRSSLKRLRDYFKVVDVLGWHATATPEAGGEVEAADRRIADLQLLLRQAQERASRIRSDLFAQLERHAIRRGLEWVFDDSVWRALRVGIELRSPPAAPPPPAGRT
jgi:hypothetical protein